MQCDFLSTHRMNDFKSKIVPQYSFPKKTYAVPKYGVQIKN